VKREFLVHVRSDWVALPQLPEAGMDRENLGMCFEARTFELCCRALASVNTETLKEVDGIPRESDGWRVDIVEVVVARW